MPGALSTDDIDRAARQAANRHYELVRAMLLAGESGEVATVIDGGYLQPERRVRTKAKAIRVGVGHLAKIEQT